MVKLELIASRCGMWSGSRGLSAPSADEAGIQTTLPAFTHSAPGGFAGLYPWKRSNGKCSLDNSNEVAPLTYPASSLSGLTQQADNLPLSSHSGAVVEMTMDCSFCTISSSGTAESACFIW